MGYSAASLSADEIALAAADKPILLTTPLYLDAPASLWSNDGTVGGTDITESGYPASRAYDGFTDLNTRPSAASTTRYLVFDFTSNPIDFDAVAIIGHNTSGRTVSVEISDDPNFGAVVAVASWTPSGANRLVDLSLNSDQRYSTVDYARVIVTGTSLKPELGEVLFLRRRQLPASPIRPFNENATRSGATLFTSEGGVSRRYIRYRGQFVLEADLTLTQQTYIDEAAAWWDGCGQGAHPFAWIREPTTNPDELMLMHMIDGGSPFPFNQTGPQAGSLAVSAFEQGPDFLGGET